MSELLGINRVKVMEKKYLDCILKKFAVSRIKDQGVAKLLRIKVFFFLQRKVKTNNTRTPGEIVRLLKTVGVLKRVSQIKCRVLMLCENFHPHSKAFFLYL